MPVINDSWLVGWLDLRHISQLEYIIPKSFFESYYMVSCNYSYSIIILCKKIYIQVTLPIKYYSPILIIFSLISIIFKPLHVFLQLLLAVRVFANGPGDLGSIPGRVIPKTLKMELDTTLLNTQHYKVRFKGKVEQSREWSSALPDTFV